MPSLRDKRYHGSDILRAQEKILQYERYAIQLFPCNGCEWSSVFPQICIASIWKNGFRIRFTRLLRLKPSNQTNEFHNCPLLPINFYLRYYYPTILLATSTFRLSRSFVLRVPLIVTDPSYTYLLTILAPNCTYKDIYIYICICRNIFRAVPNKFIMFITVLDYDTNTIRFITFD